MYPTHTLVLYLVQRLTPQASVLLGLTFRAVGVDSKDQYSLRGSSLAKEIEKDVENGLIPFFVIATVGTTSTGAIDHIKEIGEVCEFGLYL